MTKLVLIGPKESRDDVKLSINDEYDIVDELDSAKEIVNKQNTNGTNEYSDVSYFIICTKPHFIFNMKDFVETALFLQKEAYINLSKIKDDMFIFKRTCINEYLRSDDPEIQKVGTFGKENGLRIYNYEFANKYFSEDFIKNTGFFYDSNCDMHFVLYKNKRLYLPIDDRNTALEYYRQLLIEQDPESPHCYFNLKDKDAFNIDIQDDIVVDAGAAEGIFALDIINKVKKVYIIEPSPTWVKALKHTFSPYTEKVVIIDKFLSDKNDANNITLDRLYNSVIKAPVDYIKMDIEGHELEAINGGINTLTNPHLRMSICTYHRQDDAERISELLKEIGYDISFSDGYLWYPFDVEVPFRIRYSTKAIELRKGLIRAHANGTIMPDYCYNNWTNNEYECKFGKCEENEKDE